MFRLLPRRVLSMKYIVFVPPVCTLHGSSSRLVCDRNILKLNEFEKDRKRFSLRLKNKDDFWLRVLALQDLSQVFEEDLKMAWILAEEEHLPVCKDLSEKYLHRKKGTGVSFGAFRFGSTMMRTCHFLNQPQFALEIFNNPILLRNLDEIMSIILLMDLLIKSGYLEEAVKVFEKVSEMEWFFVIRNPVVLMLYAVSLYKLGTSEALHKANEFPSKIVQSKPCQRKINHLCGALALKLKDPQRALAFVSGGGFSCEVSWNIKIIALSMLNQWQVVYKEINTKKNFRCFEETKEAIMVSNNKNVSGHKFLPQDTKIFLDEVLSTISFQETSDSLPVRRKTLFE